MSRVSFVGFPSSNEAWIGWVVIGEKYNFPDAFIERDLHPIHVPNWRRLCCNALVATGSMAGHVVGTAFRALSTDPGIRTGSCGSDTARWWTNQIRARTGMREEEKSYENMTFRIDSVVFSTDY